MVFKIFKICLLEINFPLIFFEDSLSIGTSLSLRSMPGYIYLLQEREFIRSGENVYKIGRTSHHPNQRLGKYPKDSELHIIVSVNDDLESENILLKIFRKKFTRRSDIGAEYFQGDVKIMKEIIYLHSTSAHSENLENEKDLDPEDLVEETNEVSESNKSNQKKKEMESQRPVSELRDEARELGLAAYGNRNALELRLKLYYNISKFSKPGKIKSVALAEGVTLKKEEVSELHLEYVKKVSRLKLSTSDSISSQETEDPEGPKETLIEKVKKLEEFVRQQNLTIEALLSRVTSLEDRISSLTGKKTKPLPDLPKLEISKPENPKPDEPLPITSTKVVTEGDKEKAIHGNL